jgi:hypothetical protein
MKAPSFLVAGLAVTILSIAPANADDKCSSTTWPVMSQCTTRPTAYKYAASTYLECKTKVAQTGWDPSAAWWYCSSQGFKK